VPQTRAKQLLTALAYGVFSWTRVLGSRRISKLGAPRTVIDVGVGTGTPELYKAFPDAELVLVEPVAECEPALRAICERRRSKCRYVIAAVGAKKEKRLMRVVPTLLEHSSFLSRTELTSVSSTVEERVVEITTLDHVVSELGLEEPFGLKLDTEGFELDVIRGAAELLKRTRFVIAEVSILKRFEESYSFEEFIAEMSQHGFEVFDILNVAKPDASGTRYADIAFLNAKYR
jgi:FkbM family methyltransferase